MLNVQENGNHEKEIVTNGKVLHYNGHSATEDTTANPNISKTQITYEKTVDANTLTVPIAKPKKTSVVSLNMEQNEVFIIPPHETNGNLENGTSQIDTEIISEKINEIIDEAIDVHGKKMNEIISKEIDEIIHKAIEINETQLNAVNELKNKQNGVAHEINNNNDDGQFESSVWNGSNEMSKVNDGSSTGTTTPVSMEIPIKPIMNETRAFDFEYSDHSLPTSTTSTMNTMETPSTGPESIITSDIEDGYKGNDYDKQRKLEMNREQFIESQFEFLSEHLDGKTSLESISDDDKSFKPIEKHDVISSTMIECNNKTSPVSDKVDVINELTQIINCNRLETFIKPSNGTDDNVNSRSSLSNFHIGAYTNGNHENVKTAEHISHPESINGRTFVSKEPKITSVIPKQVNRSMSFHSTFPSSNESSTIEQNNGIHLSLAPRSTSYVSLISIQQEHRNGMNENGLKKSPQKSSSELSIADIPSLQSLEVMKSILSSSLSFDRLSSAKKSAKKEPEPKLDEQVEMEQSEDEEDEVEEEEERKEEEIQKPEPVQSIKAKTWKYEGPPAINVSTWGERPKSEVFIKSDNDYIFGGVSKMAALQKRFSGIQNPSNGIDKRCENDTCKLPIVRGVEYKKNVPVNGNSRKSSIVSDSTDSVEEAAIRPNYEVSRIVSDKSFSEKSGSTYKAIAINRVPLPPKPTNGSTANTLQRIQSFNSQTNGNSNGAKPNEKPAFSQFTLRKTGLKEKILDENNLKNVIKTNAVTKSIPKVNPIPTAPKPPPPAPMLKPISILKKSVSMDSADPHDQLLDSIRNFNRNTLKRKCLV